MVSNQRAKRELECNLCTIIYFFFDFIKTKRNNLEFLKWFRIIFYSWNAKIIFFLNFFRTWIVWICHQLTRKCIKQSFKSLNILQKFRRQLLAIFWQWHTIHVRNKVQKTYFLLHSTSRIINWIQKVKPNRVINEKYKTSMENAW